MCVPITFDMAMSTVKFHVDQYPSLSQPEESLYESSSNVLLHKMSWLMKPFPGICWVNRGYPLQSRLNCHHLFEPCLVPFQNSWWVIKPKYKSCNVNESLSFKMLCVTKIWFIMACSRTEVFFVDAINAVVLLVKQARPIPQRWRVKTGFPVECIVLWEELKP